jgi:VanZ family protein
MQPLRYGRAWLFAGAVLLVFGLLSALSPVQSLVPVSMNDKVLHALGFMFFMLWFGGVFQLRCAPFLVGGLAFYGILIEVLQSFTPTRQAEFLDLVADLAGILLGWALSAAGFSRWCATLESWLVPQKP